VGNGAVVMLQANLFNVEEETTTSSTTGDLYATQITGDLGELEFDKFCTQNNISYYKSSSGAAPIDRIIITDSDKTIKIHVKASVEMLHSSRNLPYWQFNTQESPKTADYYFCVGLAKHTREKEFILWVPHEIGKHKRFQCSTKNMWKYSEFLKIPNEIIDATNILQFE
jgi:hypothetical protein